MGKTLHSESSLPQLSKPPHLGLTTLQTTLIQSVNRHYSQLILEKEFGGGYSTSRVFLILPVKAGGATDARIVTKIGHADDLRHERDNYTTHVERALPFSVAQVREYYEQEDQAALNYVFAGGESLGKAVTLEEYYHTQTAQQVISTLTGLLDRALGSRWYRQSGPLNVSFRDEYGRHLPEDLEKIVAAITSDYFRVNGDQIKIPGVTGTWQNPLWAYPQLLDMPLEGRRSLVHGDLHLRNILVDETGKGWLIDFAKVSERHNLFDFIKLETYVRLMAVAAEHGAFSWSEYVQFEEALNAAGMNRNAQPPTNACLAKAYEVIQALRKIARNCVSDHRVFKTEYLPALFLYCLAMMKYYSSNGTTATQLVFVTACVVGRCLLENHPPTVSNLPPSPQVHSENWQELLSVHYGNLRKLEMQLAKFGGLNAPIHLLNQIDDEKAEIQRLRNLMKLE